MDALIACAGHAAPARTDTKVQLPLGEDWRTVLNRALTKERIAMENGPRWSEEVLHPRRRVAEHVMRNL
jgi:hypothetical protein